MLKIAFASDNRTRVNLHFGSATTLLLYDIAPSGASFCGIGEFPEAPMDGSEMKLIDKVSFLAGCDAVFARAIGASAIKQLLAQGVQPIRVEATDDIGELLQDIHAALLEGGVPWIERAQASKARAAAPDRFAEMDAEGWEM